MRRGTSARQDLLRGKRVVWALHVASHPPLAFSSLFVVCAAGSLLVMVSAVDVLLVMTGVDESLLVVVGAADSSLGVVGATPREGPSLLSIFSLNLLFTLVLTLLTNQNFSRRILANHRKVAQRVVNFARADLNSNKALINDLWSSTLKRMQYRANKLVSRKRLLLVLRRQNRMEKKI